MGEGTEQTLDTKLGYLRVYGQGQGHFYPNPNCPCLLRGSLSHLSQQTEQFPTSAWAQGQRQRVHLARKGGAHPSSWRTWWGRLWSHGSDGRLSFQPRRNPRTGWRRWRLSIQWRSAAQAMSFLR